MHTIVAVFLQLSYAIGVLGLAIYGVHALWLTVCVRRMSTKAQPLRKPKPGRLVDDDSDLPGVTIQLPIYNEQHVIERLIDACVNQDYPRNRLQIQVLDDSTDQTLATGPTTSRPIGRTWASTSRSIHRDDRTGYKAGALAHAMAAVKHPFVAIFDADFLPPPDFLRRGHPLFSGRRESAGRLRPRTMGSPQSRLFTADRQPSTGPGRPFRHRAGRTPGSRLLLRLQRLGGHLATRLHRRSCRLAAGRPTRSAKIWI